LVTRRLGSTVTAGLGVVVAAAEDDGEAAVALALPLPSSPSEVLYSLGYSSIDSGRLKIFAMTEKCTIYNIML
jgi:hypothetical protein